MGFTYDNLLRRARTVDVVWFNERQMPCGFYEIEHTTDIKNSLSKFYELQDFRADFVIIADEKRREQFYKQALLTNECKEWVAIIKTAYLRKKKRLDSGKKSINVDDKYLSIAEKFLYGELAAALGISREEVKSYILKELKEV